MLLRTPLVLIVCLISTSAFAGGPKNQVIPDPVHTPAALPVSRSVVQPGLSLMSRRQDMPSPV